MSLRFGSEQRKTNIIATALPGSALYISRTLNSAAEIGWKERATRAMRDASATM